MRRNRRRKDRENSYWKSITDAMSGLLLILLLILMMFMVRIISLDEIGTSEYQYENIVDIDIYEDDDNENQSHDSAGGYDKEPVDYIGDEQVAAILVHVIDEDTNLPIKEEGITFKLLNASHSPLTLHTYYPKKENYESFKTDENGSFYLPEKLGMNSFILQNTTRATGYGLASNTPFEVSSAFDWKNPYVVNVYVGCEKNSIQLQEVDEEGNPISVNGQYEIIAKEEIVAGGKTRYLENDKVDTVYTDENGYGESIGLYLGNYEVRPISENTGYASIESMDINVSRKDAGSNIHNIVWEKTKIILSLVDELSNTPIVSSTFSITNEKTNVSYQASSDENGMIVFEDLNKDTTYAIQQVETNEFYQLDETVYRFYVDSNGRIDGNSRAAQTISNRMIRVEISVNAMLMPISIDNVQVDIFDQSNQKVYSFVSSKNPTTITSLPKGNYTIVLNGGTKKEIEIKDTADVQSFKISKMSWMDILPVIIGILCIGMIILLIKTLKRKE